MGGIPGSMAISPSDVTGVILCGGKSSRMGEDKALLLYDGKSFLSCASSSLSFSRDIIIASGEKDYGTAYREVKDVYPGKGPLAGLHAALLLCKTEYAFVLSVDLPLFTSAFGLKILEEMDSSFDAVVPMTPEGRVHPLCALYRRSVSLIAERMLLDGRLRVVELLKNVRTRILDVPFVRDVVNVNTKEGYKNLIL